MVNLRKKTITDFLSFDILRLYIDTQNHVTIYDTREEGILSRRMKGIIRNGGGEREENGIEWENMVKGYLYKNVLMSFSTSYDENAILKNV